MHSGMRRVPAERARHAKRLGHAQSGSGPTPNFLVVANANDAKATTPAQSQQSATTVPATSQSVSTTTTSSKPPSSSALPSSSPTSSSSSTSSSALSTPSSSLSTSTPSLEPSSAQSPSVVIQSVTLAPTSATPTSTPTAQSAAAATNSGLSGPAIAGIIAGAVIVGIALIVFFVRKTYLRRRENKRISWNGTPGLRTDFRDEPKTVPDVLERSSSFISAANTTQSPPPPPFELRGLSMYPTPVSPVAPMQLPPTIPPYAYAIPTPPSATYNNPVYPIQPFAYSPAPATTHAMSRGAADAGISPALHPVGAQHAPMEAMVKCTFVPTLPDELSITTGERVFVVEQYDDGWNLCMNRRGERGMVPRECLEHAASDQPDIGWKNVERLSSLNIDERRF